jgi:hypothetical protein
VLGVSLPFLPQETGADRSFAACIASTVEVPVAEFGLHPLELFSAIARWRSWLAGRGLGLVSWRAPDKFKSSASLFCGFSV